MYEGDAFIRSSNLRVLMGNNPVHVCARVERSEHRIFQELEKQIGLLKNRFIYHHDVFTSTEPLRGLY